VSVHVTHSATTRSEPGRPGVWLSATIAGQITQLAVNEGDAVKKGQFLAPWDMANVVAKARAVHPVVQAGIFAADMKVHLVNDGPVTFWLRTAPKKPDD